MQRSRLLYFQYLLIAFLFRVVILAHVKAGASFYDYVPIGPPNKFATLPGTLPTPVAVVQPHHA